MVESLNPRRVNKGDNNVAEWQSVLSNTLETGKIRLAINAYMQAYTQVFVTDNLGNCPELSYLATVRSHIESRLSSATPFIVDVIRGMSSRAEIINSPEYQDFKEREAAQWRMGDDSQLVVGVRACVDQGMPRESISASDAKIARTLGGDDDIKYSRSKGRFILDVNPFKKKLLFAKNRGRYVVLEFLYEHLGCGRRGQNLANLNGKNEYSGPVAEVFDHLDALKSEFEGTQGEIKSGLQTIYSYWKDGNGMREDGGTWAGVVTKIAQRQAYRNVDTETAVICPIIVYPKRNADLVVGVDNLSVLTNQQVHKRGGLTEDVIENLARDGEIFSLKYELDQLLLKSTETELDFESEIGIDRGSHTFAQLQSDKYWLEIKNKFLTVTENLWRMAQDDDAKYDGVRNMISKYLGKIYGVSDVDRKYTDEDYQKLIDRRVIHHLFRALAYAWVLDTFNRGNPPGEKHLEDHGAWGNIDILGVTEHMPLGQGNMTKFSAGEALTGHQVLLHSPEVGKKKPYVIFLKFDTQSSDDAEMQPAESELALANLRETLKIWPDIALGYKIPIVLVRGADGISISRIGLTVLNTFTDITEMYDTGKLPRFVPAVNGIDEVKLVPAFEQLAIGISCGADIEQYHNEVRALADRYSAEDVQQAFRDQLNGKSSH